MQLLSSLSSLLANRPQLFAAQAQPTPQQQLLCQGATTSSGGSCQNTLTASVAGVTTTLLVVAGAIAVIIIIVGGITYVTSTGDSARVKQAKDTILYAVIGLVVAILAFAIVNFVAGNIK